MVGKAGSNGRISVGFYMCNIGPQIKSCYNFCPTSTIKIRSFTGLECRSAPDENTVFKLSKLSRMYALKSI